MDSTTPSTETIIDLLAGFPREIRTLTDALTPAQLRFRSEPDAWSATDILAHIRSCADVWGSCISTMLNQNHPTIRAINPRAWIKRTDYRDLEFQPSFEAFSMQRVDLIALCEGLSPEDWERAATVTGAGAVLERTVRFYAGWLARHERTHLKQFKQIATSLQSN